LLLILHFYTLNIWHCVALCSVTIRFCAVWV